MLYRQRVLLEFLRLAGRPLEKVELVKWSFLLKMESLHRGGSAFYEFVPYHLGPYSFGLKRESVSLESAGYLKSSESTWEQVAGNSVKPLNATLQHDVERLFHRVGHLTPTQLLDCVYQNHPAYTVNSQREKLAERPRAIPAIYTVGYEGRQLDGLLDLLVQSGIQHLADVRRNPISRRFGFHKSTLMNHCRLLNIDYTHLPELGIASVERTHLAATRDYAELFDRYEVETLPEQNDSVASLAAQMSALPTAIMCMERDACECHRGRLANRLHVMTDLPIIHLR